MLRECITQEEGSAYNTLKKPNLENTKKKINQALGFEIHLKIIRYRNENNLAFFEKIITHADILCKKGEDGEYEITQVFN